LRENVTRRIDRHHTGVRLVALLLALLAVGACGGTASTGSFGETTLLLGPTPTADEAGVHLAAARGYDGGEGVELEVTREGEAADFRLVERPPAGCIAVLAIVRPAKLVLCADEITLQDERPKVVAVARALRRGYTQAQIEPDAAVEAMLAEVPGLDRNALSTQLDAAVPTWTAGAPYFGELAPGPGRDSSIARDAGDH
jgi:ABC-type nitrate/sulfonate/bicarbonate transport system substrate-binding protein